ncbi:MAG: spermidine synthase [Deltaproteobacteria bacterium]|nr:MAG: spermidine synthase [Deltaproteobacteria bacterium]
MAKPWNTIATHPSGEGLLELRVRDGRDYLIMVDGRVLMNSHANRSELALGEFACEGLERVKAPRVLVGGLGMGYTLRAVLDKLPADASVTVAELNPVIVRWCEEYIGHLSADAVRDPRVNLYIGDVADAIMAGAKEPYDAIVVDLYIGPDAGHDPQDDPLYGRGAILNTKKALKRNGRFAVWGEYLDPGFLKRLRGCGFDVETSRPGRGGLRHVVYLATLKKRSGGKV